MSIQLIECPRDAMQGLHDFVPTEHKVDYINSLLKVGFDTIDFGSFVSPKAIPQMQDTAEVLSRIDYQNSSSKLLAIVANMRGVDQACAHEPIQYLGFPLSASERFQQRNTKKSIAEALALVEEAHQACESAGKTLVTYISMGFGNPYKEPYNAQVAIGFVEKLQAIGVKIISLADTIGSGSPQLIEEVFSAVIPKFPEITFGAHFHSTPNTAHEKIEAAYKAGCRRFDSAIGGMGGCPMAKDDLTGNIATESLLQSLAVLGEKDLGLDQESFKVASQKKQELFG